MSHRGYTKHQHQEDGQKDIKFNVTIRFVSTCTQKDIRKEGGKDERDGYKSQNCSAVYAGSMSRAIKPDKTTGLGGPA